MLGKLTDGVSQHHEAGGAAVDAAEAEEDHLHGGQDRGGGLGKKARVEAVHLGDAQLEDTVG